MCHAQEFIPTPMVKVTIRSEVKLCLKFCCSYTTETNLIKLHRKIRHNWKVMRIWFRFLCPRSRSQSGQRSKSYLLSNNSKTSEANLTKLHRKIEHNEKVCCPQELGSYAQDQGHNQIRGQIVPKLVLHIHYKSITNHVSVIAHKLLKQIW